MIMNRNLFVWTLLIGLTLMSYLSSDMEIGNFSILILMAIGIIKIAFVALQFMELHEAHIAWRIAFFSIVFVFAAIVSSVVLAD